jgi:hypothetical protein
VERWEDRVLCKELGRRQGVQKSDSAHSLFNEGGTEYYQFRQVVETVIESQILCVS